MLQGSANWAQLPVQIRLEAEGVDWQLDLRALYSDVPALLCSASRMATPWRGAWTHLGREILSFAFSCSFSPSAFFGGSLKGTGRHLMHQHLHSSRGIRRELCAFAHFVVLRSNIVAFGYDFPGRIGGRKSGVGERAEQLARVNNQIRACSSPPDIQSRLFSQQSKREANG
jgi:hypothetical protein